MRCVGLDELPLWPWHCCRCREQHRAAGRWDVTLDEPLMQLVFTGALPDGAPPEEYPRLLATAKQLRAADGGRLLMVDAWGRERVIPPICER